MDAQGRQVMSDSVNDAAKAIPPAVVYVWQWLSLPLPEIVSGLTAIYLSCLIIQFIYRFSCWTAKKWRGE